MLPSAAVLRRWFLLTILTVAYGMGAFGMLGVSPLTPSLVEGFRLARLQVAFIVPSVYVGGLLFSLPAGRLADRWGVRPTFLGGMAVGAGGLALAAGAPGFWLFLFCLFLAGIGWSVVNPVLGKVIVDLFPVRERGVAMGIKQMGLTVGGVISALILPRVAAAWSWRVAIAACALTMGAPVLASWRTLAPLAVARVDGTRMPGVPRADNWWWLRRPPLLTLFGAGLALGMVQSAVLAYLPLYGVEVLGLGADPRVQLQLPRRHRRADPQTAAGVALDRAQLDRRGMASPRRRSPSRRVSARMAGWASTSSPARRRAARASRGCSAACPSPPSWSASSRGRRASAPSSRPPTPTGRPGARSRGSRSWWR